MPIYTVGNEINYDCGLKKMRSQKGKYLCKMGKTSSYPGGFALQTVADAQQLITDWGKEGDWAVYAVDARWGQDTRPSQNGWWHSLQVDSIILHKVFSQ